MDQKTALSECSTDRCTSFHCSMGTDVDRESTTSWSCSCWWRQEWSDPSFASSSYRWWSFLSKILSSPVTDLSDCAVRCGSLSSMFHESCSTSQHQPLLDDDEPLIDLLKLQKKSSEQLKRRWNVFTSWTLNPTWPFASVWWRRIICWRVVGRLCRRTGDNLLLKLSLMLLCLA